MYTQLDIAKGRLASGKRLRAQDKAALMAEARAKGEKVSGLQTVEVAATLVYKLIWLVILLVVFGGCAYACLTAH